MRMSMKKMAVMTLRKATKYSSSSTPKPRRKLTSATLMRMRTHTKRSQAIFRASSGWKRRYSRQSDLESRCCCASLDTTSSMFARIASSMASDSSASFGTRREGTGLPLKLSVPLDVDTLFHRSFKARLLSGDAALTSRRWFMIRARVSFSTSLVSPGDRLLLLIASLCFSHMLFIVLPTGLGLFARASSRFSGRRRGVLTLPSSILSASACTSCKYTSLAPRSRSMSSTFVSIQRPSLAKSRRSFLCIAVASRKPVLDTK
mmetsp:Transcript_4782/g.13636  ORF Transcript_4782/g.13636 Transcript_4782/m.13636 type:complete len:261 (+) Transcript_4782:1644-2426(+)